jgi:hypothetical protein
MGRNYIILNQTVWFINNENIKNCYEFVENIFIKYWLIYKKVTFNFKGQQYIVFYSVLNVGVGGL